MKYFKYFKTKKNIQKNIQKNFDLLSENLYFCSLLKNCE